MTWKWKGLLAGPLAAGQVWLVLPDECTDAAGAEVAIAMGARATLALLAWMAAWGITKPAAMMQPIGLGILRLDIGGAKSNWKC